MLLHHVDITIRIARSLSTTEQDSAREEEYAIIPALQMFGSVVCWWRDHHLRVTVPCYLELLFNLQDDIFLASFSLKPCMCTQLGFSPGARCGVDVFL